MTSDHSLVNALLRAGQITEEEAAHHPQRNIITQSIGQKDELEPDYGLVTVEADDYILINSDGLTNMLGPDEIRDIVLSDVSLEEKAKTFDFVLPIMLEGWIILLLYCSTLMRRTQHDSNRQNFCRAI